MEKREHPRIQLPLLVELQHPSLGRKRCLARDISKGGVFVNLPAAPMREGAKLKLTLLNINPVDHHPTPTVDMVVKRIEDNGIGLAFVNKTSSHLWESVERLRDELAVGRDYFQIYVSVLAIDQEDQLLLVQEHGRWTLPGVYLVVGQVWQKAVEAFLEERFSLKMRGIEHILNIDTSGEEDVPEAAVMSVYPIVRVDAGKFALDKNRYRTSRWIDRHRDIDENTFLNDEVRRIAGQTVDWLRVQQPDEPDSASTG